jgi:hypothetical protein
MRGRAQTCFLAPAVAVLGLIAALPASAGAAVPEVARVQRHLDGALELLAKRDLGGLSAAQRVRRAGAVAALQAYRDAGLFPQNRDFPGQRVPYFRDADGTLCAVGHLIARGGGADELALVEAVARTRNHARIAELAASPAGPALGRWLTDHGLTVAEAARIQPDYCGSLTQCLCPGNARFDVVGLAHVDSVDDYSTFLILDDLQGTGSVPQNVGDQVVIDRFTFLNVGDTVVVIYDRGQFYDVVPVEAGGQVSCRYFNDGVDATGSVAVQDFVDALLSSNCSATLLARYPDAGSCDACGGPQGTGSSTCMPYPPLDAGVADAGAGADGGTSPSAGRGCNQGPASPAGGAPVAGAGLLLGLALMLMARAARQR